MSMDQVLDTSPQVDITKNKVWIQEQIDRFVAWEIFIRMARGEEMLPMAPLDLCDRIGVNKEYVYDLIQQIKQRKKIDAK